jgi:hypothetical protein
VNVLRPGHQDVDEVVDHDRNLGAIDRLEPQQPIVRSPEGAGNVGHDRTLLVDDKATGQTLLLSMRSGALGHAIAKCHRGGREPLSARRADQWLRGRTRAAPRFKCGRVPPKRSGFDRKADTVAQPARHLQVAEPRKTPPAPKHLRAPTRRWYRSVVTDYDLEPHHVRLLQAAAECWDRLRAARQAIERDGSYWRIATGS